MTEAERLANELCAPIPYFQAPTSLEEAAAAELRRLQAEVDRLNDYDTRLSAVMPADFKDWHENSRNEWPELAAGTITDLREQRADLEAEVAALKEELLEQARVNGMGGEREAKLLAENAALCNENAKLYGWVNDLAQKSIRERNLEAEVARLNAALKSEQDRTTHIGTHVQGCETWGPRHYDCLLAKYAKLNSALDDVLFHVEDAMRNEVQPYEIEMAAKRARAALGEQT